MLNRPAVRIAELLAGPLLMVTAGLAQCVSVPQSTPRLNIAALRKQAEAGDPHAETSLGMAYRDGNGVPAEASKAAEWFRKAADQGDAAAQNSLGVLYLTGSGVPKDREQAFAWYRKSALQRYAPGVFNVAISYYNGDGTPEDMVTAYAWMLLADELGEQAAHDAVARTGAELGGQATEGELKLAQILEAGVEVPQNEAGAARWYRLAGDHGNAEAQVKYGLMLADGRGTAKDTREAFRLLQRAAEKKSAPAMFTVGYAYQKGTLGQSVDIHESIKWYEGAAAGGHPGAMVNLGLMNADGTNGPPNYERAYFWLYMADAFNMPQAKNSIPIVTAHLLQKQITAVQESVAAWWQKNGKALLVRRRQEPTNEASVAVDPPGSSGGDTAKVYPIGGEVQAPKLLSGPEPRMYPGQKQGTVSVLFTVGPDGRTKDIQIVQSLSKELDQQAIDAVKEWKFSPATRKGEPVSVRVTTQVNFSIH